MEPFWVRWCCQQQSNYIKRGKWICKGHTYQCHLTHYNRPQHQAPIGASISLVATRGDHRIAQSIFLIWRTMVPLSTANLWNHGARSLRISSSRSSFGKTMLYLPSNRRMPYHSFGLGKFSNWCPFLYANHTYHSNVVGTLASMTLAKASTM